MKKRTKLPYYLTGGAAVAAVLLATAARASARKQNAQLQLLSVEQLRQVMPKLSEDKARALLPFLNWAMVEAEVTTPLRMAAFLAQVAEESAELRYMEEIESGSEYEGRKDLGNTEPGDGIRYKGRGPIQLTGRYNYRAAGLALGLKLEENPALAAEPAVGFRVAAWYWTSHDLNTLADNRNFSGITLRINGGLLGEDLREKYYQRALRVLGGAA